MKETHEHSFLLGRKDSRNEITVSRHEDNLLNRLLRSQLDHVYAQKNVNHLLFVPGTPCLVKAPVC